MIRSSSNPADRVVSHVILHLIVFFEEDVFKPTTEYIKDIHSDVSYTNFIKDGDS
jgi:hypothetical protein